jgi:curli biogenesis system outer membrane secretion channel CsgG
MKVKRFSLIIFLPAMMITGCTTATMSSGGPRMEDVLNQPYNGPKARIAVARFENKVEGNMMMSFQREMARIMLQAQAAMAEALKNMNKQQGGAGANTAWLSAWTSFSDPISTGVKEMLISELVSCNRFLVYERENIADILAEQQLANSNLINPKTNIQQGKLEGVELYIYGALTEFEAEQQGGEIGIPIPAFGTTFDANLAYKSAQVGMDLRIVDTRTGRIVATTTVKGNATDVRLGGQERTLSGNLPKVLQGYKNTPIEAAIRKMLRAAVGYVITKTPADYYHYEK